MKFIGWKHWSDDMYFEWMKIMRCLYSNVQILFVRSICNKQSIAKYHKKCVGVFVFLSLSLSLVCFDCKLIIDRIHTETFHSRFLLCFVWRKQTENHPFTHALKSMRLLLVFLMQKYTHLLFIPLTNRIYGCVFFSNEDMRRTATRCLKRLRGRQKEKIKSKQHNNVWCIWRWLHRQSKMDHKQMVDEFKCKYSKYLVFFIFIVYLLFAPHDFFYDSM